MTETFAVEILLSPLDALSSEKARLAGFVLRDQVWGLPCDFRSEARVDENVDAAIDRLAKVWSVLDLRADAVAEVFIGISVSGNGGVILDPSQVRRLAELNLGLFIDIYCDD